MVARLHWIKGYSFVLSALKMLKEADYIFSFNIVGEGYAYEEILFLINELDLIDCVKLHLSLPHDSINEILKYTDIYIQYSFHEGFCNSVLEAQATGCLCIVSDSGALVENIVNNETGFVVEKLNSVKLFEKIVEVINLDVIRKKQIRKNAVKRIIDNFNLEIQEKKFKEFYER
jgi:colanic acid/amylovoran biosynthesis glycosyltransferase